MSVSSRRSPALAVISAVLALLSAIATIYYWTQPTSLFASPYGIHHKHAAVFAVLTLIFLAGAIIARPRAVR